MNECTFCPNMDNLICVKFAMPREDNILKEYKGGYIRYRYLCPNCAFKVNHITQQFPQETRIKK